MYHSGTQEKDKTTSIVAVSFLFLTLILIVRLFVLQVFEHNYYNSLATGMHEIYKRLFPVRGSIYLQDARTKKEYAAAINRDYYLIYSVPKEISEIDITSTTDALADILKLDDEDKKNILAKLNKRDSLYAPIAKKQIEEAVVAIKDIGLKGIYSTTQVYRFYPENELGGNVLGFTGFDDNGDLQGSYGIEGYWNKTLAGRGGFLSGERGAGGTWIALAGRTIDAAEDGADLVLTIDRSLQYQACDILKKGLTDYGAKSAALTLLNPKTGAILAMCSFPDFDPNNYSKVDNEVSFNNTNIFTPYEPGSVFKAVTMAIGLDLDLVTPNTTFIDPCVRHFDKYSIHNAMDKCYGTITMTQVLENSVNTGMMWVQDKIGQERFKNYIDKFGFGEKVGVEINTESKGDVHQLETKRPIDYATASFGQGITVTPLQLAMAYSALANGGQMYKPYIVEEVRYSDGRKEKTTPQLVGTVISDRASKMITGMLVSVVEKTYVSTVKIKDYYIAGKTGTAQIPGPGGYTDETNHTFAGYFPADNPQFVLVVKYEAPKRAWAEGTTGPVFKQVADFTLKYFGIPPMK